MNSSRLFTSIIFATFLLPVQVDAWSSRPSDADSDGIPDTEDQCPDTQSNTTVNNVGCALYQLDTDGDGINDADDLFPNDSGEWSDLDGDGIGDNGDHDRDGDGVDNDIDVFPNDPTETNDLDGDGIGDNSDADIDGDGVTNDLDAFPRDILEWVDTDGDGIGNNSDPDIDGDGVSNEDDAFPLDPAEISDLDGDGIGDNGDEDIDGDGINNLVDTFPNDPAEWADTDGDGIGNNNDADIDGDGVTNESDAFPEDPAEISDLDSDGIGDNSDPDRDGDGIANVDDAFPNDSSETTDTDGDGLGDNSDPDIDGDGVSNDIDAFPYNPEESSDLDDDGIGDNADPDRDGDGVANHEDIFPDDSAEWADTDSDGLGDNSDPDIDDDGFGNDMDEFPYDSQEWLDSDGDGIGDNTDSDIDGDGYSNELEADLGTDPLDHTSIPQDMDSDGIPDVMDADMDGDGIANEDDVFPYDPLESSDLDLDGVGDNSDPDIDGDGVLNGDDAFPYDSQRANDLDGDGIADSDDPDIDGDGFSNEMDEFPLDPQEWLDTDGDGVGDNSDSDIDGDGVVNEQDEFPYDPSENADLDGDGIGDNSDPDKDGDGVQDVDDRCIEISDGIVEDDGCPPPFTQPAELAGDDQIFGTEYKDFLVGYTGNDDLYANGGDILLGGSGNDNYHLSATSGDTLIHDVSGINRIIFDNTVTYNDVAYSLMRGSDDLIISYSENSEVTIIGFFVWSNSIATFNFSNGQTLTASQVYSAYGVNSPTLVKPEKEIIVGTNGQDNLGSYPGESVAILGLNDDEVILGESDQYLVGGHGSDTYNASDLASGHYIFDIEGYNQLVFGPETAYSDIRYSKLNGSDHLVITNVSTSESFTVYGFFSYLNTISEINIGGSVVTADQIFGLWGDTPPIITDSIYDLLRPGPTPDDLDFDGVLDGADLCPNTEVGTAVNSDGCGDYDNDGVAVNVDLCPNTPLAEAGQVNAEGCGPSQRDTDGDGVNDSYDQFPEDPTETTDSDNDGVGDNSDIDIDGDGVLNENDAFPYNPNEWSDVDGDGVGDNSDTDSDGDGYSNDVENAYGSSPTDPESTPPDMDRDFIVDDLDNDIDGDGYANATDAFPEDERDHSDMDGDGIGNNVDDDIDGDGVLNTDDDMPWNAQWSNDLDHDLIPDSIDDDDDGDGYSDNFEIESGTDPLYRLSSPGSRPLDGGYHRVIASGTVESMDYGDDGHYQKGIPMSFERPAGLDIVYDRNTKLLWHDDRRSKDRQFTLGSAKSYCGNLDVAGISDWRVPNVYELLSLVDYSNVQVEYNYGQEPLLLHAEFQYRNSPVLWASGSEVGSNPVVDFRDGTAGDLQNLNVEREVRCVSDSFIDGFIDRPYYVKPDLNQDVIVDPQSNLMWQDVQANTQDKLNYYDALNYCEGSSVGGFQDWRLPNYKELQKFIWASQGYYTRQRLDSDFSTYDASDAYWSSTRTQRAGTNNYINTIGNPGSFISFEWSLKSTLHYARCVRDFRPPVAVINGPREIFTEQYAFYNAITEQNDAAVTYEWLHNSVVQRTGTEYSVKYNAPGTYIFNLSAKDAVGHEVTHTIEITVLDATGMEFPVADAGPDQRVVAGSTIRLDGSQSYSESRQIESYLWMVNGETVARTIDFEYIADELGSTTFTLNVIDSEGYSSIDQVVVDVVSPADSVFADAGADFQAYSGVEFTLDASLSESLASNISSYEWFIDGELIGEGRVLQYAILSSGDTLVELRVTDEFGNTNADTVVVTVLQNLFANAGEYLEVYKDNTFLLDASNSTIIEGNITSYVWLLNDQEIGRGATIEWMFAEIGVQDVVLQVQDQFGNESSDIVQVNVLPGVPIASAGDDLYVAPMTTFTLDASGSYDTNGEQLEYRWIRDGIYISQWSSDPTFDVAITDDVVEFRLIVRDESNYTSQDAITIYSDYSAENLYHLDACEIQRFEQFVDTPPVENIPWAAAGYYSVDDIEKSYNYARKVDPTANSYLRMPAQEVWDGLGYSQQALYLINSERISRGLLPLEGISPEVEAVAQEYAEYMTANDAPFGHHADGRSPLQRMEANANLTGRMDVSENVLAAVGASATSIAKHVYAFMYEDKYVYVGTSWGHRSNKLSQGFNDDSLSLGSEGLMGIGLSIEDYNYDSINAASVHVYNVIDPDSSWTENEIIRPEISPVEGCKNQEMIELSAPIDDVTSIYIRNNPITIFEGDSFNLEVVAKLNDGTIIDVSNDVHLASPDVLSHLSSSGSVFTALIPGTVNLRVEHNGVVSNPLVVTIYAEDTLLPDQTDILGPDAELIPDNATYRNYDPNALTVYTGIVIDGDENPVQGVSVRFTHHPEFGSVETNYDGRYVISAPSGQQAIQFELFGYTGAQREVIGPSGTWQTLDDVMLLERDTVGTDVTLGAEPVVHRSTIITDEFGSRSSTVVFNGINSATILGADGYTREITDFRLTSTEYTDVRAMPGVLPESSGFTYCTDLHVEGTAMGDTVQFDGGVVMMVDNFLGFNVGEIVPIGYYDIYDVEWKPSQNGVVARVLDTNDDGVSDGLDINDDGVADDLTGNGSALDESVGLEGYPDGHTVWWGKFDHFSSVDYNFDQSDVSDDAKNQMEQESDTEDNKETDEPSPCASVASYMKPRDQEFHEDIPVPGTDLTLHYSSRRASAYEHEVDVNVMGDSVPTDLQSIEVHLNVAGKRFIKEVLAESNSSVTFFWDGINAVGVRPKGLIKGSISIGYKFDSVYTTPGNVSDTGSFTGEAWNQNSTNETAVESREPTTQWIIRPVSFVNSYSNQFADGWSVSSHHNLVEGDKIYLGSGDVDDIMSQSSITNTGAIESYYDGDDAYYGENGVPLSYSINSDGTVTDHNTGLTWEAEHSNIFVTSSAQASAHCDNLSVQTGKSWRVPATKEVNYTSSKSVIGRHMLFLEGSTVSLNTNFRSSPSVELLCVHGDFKDPAATDSFARNNAVETVTDLENSVMWQDTVENLSYRTNWEGAIDYCEALDHAGYDDWRLPTVNELLIASRSTVFQYYTYDIFSEDGLWHYNGEEQRAFWSSTTNYTYADLAWGVEHYGFANGYFNKQDAQQYVRCVRDDQRVIRSPYRFDRSGRHLATVDMDTAKELKTFEYNDAGQLETIVDQFGNRVSFEYEDGKLRTVVGKDGQRTTLDIDNDNLLQSVTYEDGSMYDFGYLNGLMEVETEPNGNTFYHRFDSRGRLTEISDTEGGLWNIYDNPTGYGNRLFGFTTEAGQSFETLYETLTNGSVRETTTAKDGRLSVTTRSDDKLNESVASCGVTSSIERVIDPRTKREIPSRFITVMPSGLTSETLITKTYGNDGAEFSTYTETTATNGKVTTVNFNAETGVESIASPEGRTTTITFDPQNLQTDRIESSGLNATEFSYDGRGRLETVQTGSRITGYTYDPVTGKVKTVTNALNQVTTYDYDIKGNLTRITYDDDYYTEFGRDANGNLTSTTVPVLQAHDSPVNGVNNTDYQETPLGARTKYYYDEDRRVTDIELPSGEFITNNYIGGKLDSTATPERTTTYTYTCGSTIDEIITGSEKLNYDYDGELVTNITYSGELNQSISYGYNNDFMVDEMTYPGIATPVGYDNDGLLTSIHGYTIDRFESHGMPRRVFNSNLNRAYTYNGYGNVDSMTQTVGDTSIFTSFTHNLAGQIDTRTDVVDTPAGTRTDSYQYFYDNRNRLEQVKLNNVVIEEYDYDSNGNRSLYSSTRAALAGTSTYNDDDQFEANSNASYGYDANGRLATRTRNVVDGDPVITTYDYSSDGRLLSVTTPEHTTTYRHNAFGNRVAKLVDGEITEKYLWENKPRLLATFDGTTT